MSRAIGEKGQGEYRCEATSIGGFVQQLAVCYVGRGYRFYSTGVIPEKKDPKAVDAKLIDRYGVALTKHERARRKLAGGANVQYLRHDRFFVLLATPGEHRLFEEEAETLRDCGRVSIKVGGYAIGHRNGHPRVQIEQGEYKRLKAYFVDLAIRRSTESLEAELSKLPYEPYAPVRRQLLTILRGVNRARAEAGLALVSKSCLRFKRRLYRPFDPIQSSFGPIDLRTSPLGIALKGLSD